MKLLYWPLNVAALLYLLLIAAFPRVAWPAGPSPVPSPMATLPVNYDQFCASRHSGAYQGLATSPALGVVVMCEKADYRFYRSAVPTKWPRFPDAKATP
jgi:hypothetical protein